MSMTLRMIQLSPLVREPAADEQRDDGRHQP